MSLGITRLLSDGLTERVPGGHARRGDLVDPADLTGEAVAVRVLVAPEVAPREPVQVRVGALLGDLDDGVADGEVTVGVVGVRDLDGDLPALVHVEVFLPSRRRVDQDVTAIVVDPDRRYLWAAVGHQGGEMREGGLREQIEELPRDGAGGARARRPPRRRGA